MKAPGINSVSGISRNNQRKEATKWRSGLAHRSFVKAEPKVPLPPLLKYH